MLLEVPPLPSGSVAAPEVGEEVAGKHGVQLEEEIVGGHVQMEVQLFRGEFCKKEGGGEKVDRERGI